MSVSPLNQGRSVNPGDTPSRQGKVYIRLSPSSLNQGRSVNPGDTGMMSVAHFSRTIAQPRPERKPRRHCQFSGKRINASLAQPRPERKPRRHPSTWPDSAFLELDARSTKAGA